MEALGQANFGEGTGRMRLSNVQCTGNERSLVNCAANSSGVNSCTHAQDVGVRCQSGILIDRNRCCCWRVIYSFIQLGCHEGDIRLRDGTNSLEGRVEICMNNTWGTVCDDGWDRLDARVVCRQLGLSVTNTIATNRASYGQGTGPVLLSNLRCSGTESRLSDCAMVMGRSCFHSEDAGVRCDVRTGTVHMSQHNYLSC